MTQKTANKMFQMSSSSKFILNMMFTFGTHIIHNYIMGDFQPFPPYV